MERRSRRLLAAVLILAIVIGCAGTIFGTITIRKRHIYMQNIEAGDRYLEAGDWLVCCLTGQRVRNSCAAGYKAYYNGAGSGYPPEELFRAAGFQPGQPVSEKMPSPVIPIGTRAGGLLPDMAGKLHLLPGTPVAAAVLDAKPFPAYAVP